MGKSDKKLSILQVIALLFAALLAVAPTSQGRTMPKPEKKPAGAEVYRPQNIVGGYGGGIFVPGAPPIVGGGTFYVPGFGGTPFAGGFPGVVNQPVGGLGGGAGGLGGGIGHP